METIQKFAIDCIVRGRHLGVSPSRSVLITALSSNNSGSVIERKLWLSFSQPSFPPDDKVVLWFDPDSWQFYKSTNWRDANPTWELQTSYESLFDETQASATEGGQLTTPLILSRNPQEDMEAVTKLYLDTIISTITTGTGNPVYGEPVASIAALKAVNITLIPDKQIRYVEDQRRIYAYDAQSSLTADNDFIVTPVQGIGRWISTDAKVIDAGTF